MKYKIKIKEGLSIEQVHEIIENGGRFICYQYCISIVFAVTLQRFSPAYLIEKDQPLPQSRVGYNMLSFILGWWGFPWGPIYTIRSLRTNRKGIDMTKLIVSNMDEESLNSGYVLIQTNNELFTFPSKPDAKEFKKTINGIIGNDQNFRKIIVALFIATEEYEDPYYTIGLEMNRDFEEGKNEYEKALRKRFQKKTHFEWIDLKASSKEADLLIEQGLCLLDRS